MILLLYGGSTGNFCHDSTNELLTFCYRDPLNGFYCDGLWFNTAILTPCGPNNNFYSAAANGMGLVSEAIMVELGGINILSKFNHPLSFNLLSSGYQTRQEGEERLIHTLNNMLDIWPRNLNETGWMLHFTNR